MKIYRLTASECNSSITHNNMNEPNKKLNWTFDRAAILLPQNHSAIKYRLANR